MSVSGMKKQLHKASQLLNEKLMGAEGTKMDEDFVKMEKSVAVIHSLLVELLSKTTEFLQPNPADRAKLNMLNTVSRIRGQGKSVGYPQTEGMLGECMVRYGQELGAASEFGGALSGVGEALQQVAQARDILDVTVKQTFIDPLQGLHNTELKEIRYQLKKLNGRRLDFDYKRRRRGKVPAEEVQQAWDKFITFKEVAERSMFILLQNDANQLTRLAALVAALLDFHRNAHRILLGLHGNLSLSVSLAQLTVSWFWISPVAGRCTPSTRTTRVSWTSMRATSSSSPIRSTPTGTRARWAANQDCSPSVMWTCWCLCRYHDNISNIAEHATLMSVFSMICNFSAFYLHFFTSAGRRLEQERKAIVSDLMSHFTFAAVLYQPLQEAIFRLTCVFPFKTLSFMSCTKLLLPFTLLHISAVSSTHLRNAATSV